MSKLRKRLGAGEITEKRGTLWRACVAEFFGNLLLNFFGCASCIFLKDSPTQMDLVRIALSFGLVIFVTVQALCHVSGGHFNPAVTLTMLINGKTPLIRALLYIVFQCAGAISGSAILKATTSKNEEFITGNWGITSMNSQMHPAQGFGIEFFLGFILMLVILGVCDEHRNPPSTIPAPLAIGLAVVVGHLAAVPLTGASMNPARSFGSAVIAHRWEYHWIYWLGPCLGSLAAGLIYRHVFAAPKPVRLTISEDEEKEMQRFDGKQKEDP